MSEIVDFNPKLNFHKVHKDKVVTLKYALFDQGTEELIEYRDDLIYLHGGYEPRLAKLQDAVEGFEVGMKTEVALKSDEAFGTVDPNLIINDQEQNFPAEAARVGTELDGETPEGQVIKFRVTKVENGMITVDGNHPLAGRDLRFVVEVKDIRAATPQELEAGHAFRVVPSTSGASPERH
jgi:FKBP-type peptidyl-prolyl cis-trans isomerase SlyD